jgi:hypothetical protein
MTMTGAAPTVRTSGLMRGGRHSPKQLRLLPSGQSKRCPSCESMTRHDTMDLAPTGVRENEETSACGRAVYWILALRWGMSTALGVSRSISPGIFQTDLTIRPRSTRSSSCCCHRQPVPTFVRILPSIVGSMQSWNAFWGEQQVLARRGLASSSVLVPVYRLRMHARTLRAATTMLRVTCCGCRSFNGWGGIFV